MLYEGRFLLIVTFKEAFITHVKIVDKGITYLNRLSLTIKNDRKADKETKTVLPRKEISTIITLSGLVLFFEMNITNSVSKLLVSIIVVKAKNIAEAKININILPPSGNIITKKILYFQ